MPVNPHVRAARDFLVKHREDYETAVKGFSWPELPLYNFATDWFDGLAEERPDDTALWVIDSERQTRLSFADLASRSVAAAHWLSSCGLRRGDRLLLVLGNVVPLWEIMLAAIRLGVVVIPATPQLSAADLADRVDRGGVAMVIADATDVAKFALIRSGSIRAAVGEPTDADLSAGWLSYADSAGHLGRDPHFPGASKARDPLLLYFTSGTTAQPKLVEHTQVSYPIGHLSTMYWMGLRPGDVHLNISSPGWAKHAWSNFFSPWLAGATVLVYNYDRFDPAELLQVLERAGVTTFCAPPTVWRMLVQTDLTQVPASLREVLSAGEPLNPEVIARVEQAWGLTIRDGYGQTETSAQVGNPPGAPIKPGSMGRPLPGFQVVLLDPATGAESETEGELCLRLEPRPLPLMTGYKERAEQFDDEKNGAAFAGDVYHTGDVVSRDAEGYLTYVGRADDVFKASDYRISPFELESVLIEHAAVAEAAVVPAPDALRLAVPKAYIVLASGFSPDSETARSILAYVREQLAPYKRIRRIEFAELPKTVSGKIRRVELRAGEMSREHRSSAEFWDSDFEF
ncbi:AMP-binding protein [Microlunatus panaciterrae]|uniref:Acetyl-CoA synthetase n=1 Tax=Microlunatus panaciterrae TaxID=400768 RepID=A0ABS2RPY4_9ACTN|nr:AMP-binding protein [Microlunatus panaciterrae]MBM7800652.1 acetyl-CoA synthetase [Microlunatus panaciterrae]